MNSSRRRRFLTATGTLLATSLSVRAQPPRRERPFVISGTSTWVTPEYRARFVANMRGRGWQESRDYVLVDSGLPYGAPPEESARRALAMSPNVVITINTGYALAVQRLTTNTPIVMWTSGHPVEAGVAVSLARPGRNVTGNTIYAGTGYWAKLLEFLREASPGIKRIAFMWDYVPPVNPTAEVAQAKVEAARGAGALGLELTVVDVRNASELTAALATIGARRPDALAFTSGFVHWAARQEILAFAMQHRLPTITDFSTPPEDTGAAPLLVYSADLTELEKQAVDYIDRIMRGTPPGELPIRQPSKFELVASAKMARAIGLDLPRSILLRADRVIE